MSECWTKYADSPPTTKGLYQWRIPSVTVPNTVLLIYAEMRMRGNGYKPMILSPEFDTWDGYRVEVPIGCEWRDALNVSKETAQRIEVEGLIPRPCPYCQSIPQWVAHRRGNSGGVVMAARPQNLNSWRLECCKWGRTPDLSDPRLVETKRREAFAHFESLLHRDLRQLLWLRHGCPLSDLYGDDGEMQCATCGIDFKRDSAGKICTRFIDISVKMARESKKGVAQ